MKPDQASLLLERIVRATHSHIDGRDLLAEIHPRSRLDIKRRVDGADTWFEADWLSDLYDTVKEAKAFLYSQSLVIKDGILTRNEVMNRARSLGILRDPPLPGPGEADKETPRDGE